MMMRVNEEREVRGERCEVVEVRKSRGGKGRFV